LPRPEVVVAVVGTATEVGKTWVAAAVAAELRRRGVSVAARKPAQSFAPGDVTDAALLAAATGVDAEAVCPPHRWYRVPYAPPMAADALGLPAFGVADLVAELAWPEEPVAQVGLVEGAGSLRSPLADDGDNADLLRLLVPDVVVLVADAGLGTIGDTRLAVDALAGGPPVLVLLNRFDASVELHRRNVAWLRDRDGVDVMTSAAELASRLLTSVQDERAGERDH
jgi:dethiobiotin synthetase